MKSTRWSRVTALLACLILTAGLLALPPEQNPNPVDPGGGNGKYCNWCTATRCGCDDPPEGYRLSSWDCVCGSTSCERSCNYTPL